jgi:hypothetical protein
MKRKILFVASVPSGCFVVAAYIVSPTAYVAFTGATLFTGTFGGTEILCEPF